jgi:hypothetical protein
MRFKQNQRSDRGSTLIIILVLTGIIGFTLTSYLTMVSNQNISIMRSMAWNSAIAVSEAGIEEAMAHLNENGTNRTADGWIADGTNVVKERTIGRDQLKISISRTVEPPLITCEARVINPVNGQLLPHPRIVRVGTTNKGVFVKAMVAKGEIDLSGNRIRTDSFDSDDLNHSNNGRYDRSRAKDNGDIATNSSLVDSLNSWNADIYGRVSTGPGGTVRVGPNGSVGDSAWHEAGYKGIKPNWGSDDMNVQFPDVEPPFSGSGWIPKANENVGGTNYNYVVGAGEYELPSLSLSGQNKMLITGHAVLLVRGNVSLSGQSYIAIQPGASLQLYVAGPSTSLGGQGILNSNAKASTFGYWGLNSNTSVSMSGNAAFTGTIYAPYAALTLSGGGNDTYDIVGATVSNTIKMNGHFQFHYDEALAKVGPRTRYTVISWNEFSWSEL